jgi:hypothetical protein
VYVGFVAIGKRILCCTANENGDSQKLFSTMALISLARRFVNLDALKVKNECMTVKVCYIL